MSRPPIYLDNAATSWPKPQRVLDAMSKFLAEQAGNPGRAGHRLSLAAARVVAEARLKLARLVRASDAHRIVHCFNCTDALNIAIKGCLRQGDHVICSALDHNSVSRPLQSLADAGVITLTRVGCVPLPSRQWSSAASPGASTASDVTPISGVAPISNRCPGVAPVSNRCESVPGFIDPHDIHRALTPQTRLITLPHASNVIGTIQPVAEIGRIARRAGALLLVDAAQSAGLLDIDVEAMHIDLLAASGHKSLLGPPGTGFLYVGPRADLRPWREGGTGSNSTDPHQPLDLPTRLEAGTPNTVGLAGLAAALDELHPAESLEHERRLARRLVDMLSEIPRIHLVGPPPSERTIGVVSFTIEGLSPVDAAAILDESFNIAVRPGLHCAPFAHEALGTLPDGTLRASPGITTIDSDADTLAAGVSEIANSS